MAGLILTQTAGVIMRAISQEEELRDLRSRVESIVEFSGIIGKDPKMQEIYRLIDNIASTDVTALILGENGTGKEMVASAIHNQSLRKDKPFVVINCSAYPAALLESELFGHEKGAFTGAIRQKPGRFEQADGGTVFLDEVGDIPPSAQIKLLRVLQTQQFERVGGEKTLDVNVRILAATNKDLDREVKNGRFREDLFYRLNVIPVNLPPLNQRHTDIPLLARHFLRHFAQEQDKEIEDLRKAIQYTEFEITRLIRQGQAIPRPGEIIVRNFCKSWELNQNRTNITSLITGWTTIDNLKEVIILLNKEIKLLQGETNENN